MPKIVDPAQRRAHIVDSVFRVVAAGGVEAATLKNVAADAGLAIGSVRHYFDSHDEILLAAAEAMVERVSARLLARRDTFIDDPTPASLGALLEELLPLDERRAAEVRVWLGFTAAAMSRSELAPFATAMTDGTADAVKRGLTRLGAPADDAAVTATVAVVDGLALAGIAPRPIPPARLRAALRDHLQRLTAPTAGPESRDQHRPRTKTNRKRRT